jgi:mannitol/fructose-specific phosphotransferase system IIA component (Ntr-type)
MAASRYPLALSRDKMIPSFLSKVNARFRTPTAAIYLTGGFMIAVQFFDLETLVKTASAVILASYVLSNLSVIILRESHIRNYRPTFRAPLYPWLQIFSIVAFSIMIFSMGLKTLVTISIIPVALVFYMIYGRLATKEFALMHLIERITNKKLTQHSLENELREIIRQRDDIVKDEFDMLVENAPVMMVDKTVDISELFKQVAHVLSDDISADEQEIFKLLYDREDESSTAISSDVAVPHIIIEGERIFHLLLIKSAEGIYFSEYSPKVKAIFLLVGTRDLRNQHLKTLAAVAQVIQDRRFSECWDLAENKQQVRDVVLLAKRQRSTSFRD